MIVSTKNNSGVKEIQLRKELQKTARKIDVAPLKIEGIIEEKQVKPLEYKPLKDARDRLEEIKPKKIKPVKSAAGSKRKLFHTGIDVRKEKDHLKSEIGRQQERWEHVRKEYPDIDKTAAELAGPDTQIEGFREHWRSPEVTLIETPGHKHDMVAKRGVSPYWEAVSELFYCADLHTLHMQAVPRKYRKADGKEYVLMDYVQGQTLEDLSKQDPGTLESNKLHISYELGRQTAFTYAFGVKDGYQSNYIFNPLEKRLYRVDKEKFLQMPSKPRETLLGHDDYTQEIAGCELDNLAHLPSFRDRGEKPQILLAFELGFKDQFKKLSKRKNKFRGLIAETRETLVKINPVKNRVSYDKETGEIQDTVDYLLSQDPEKVLERLYEARREVARGEVIKG